QLQAEFRVFQNDLSDIRKEGIQIFAGDRRLARMSTVVAHIETVAQPRMLVAVDQAKVFQNKEQVRIENALKFRQRFNRILLVVGLETAGSLCGHFFSSLAKCREANLFDFVVDARDRGAPSKNDAAPQRLD